MGNWARPAGLLLGTALLAVLLNSDFLLFVLGLEVLLLPAAGWTAARLAKKVRVRVVIPESRVFQCETFQIQAELENQSILPIAQASVRLAVRAYPEQEALLLTGKLFLNGGEQGSLCFRLEGSHCTSLEIQPDRLTITDPLGLFQRRCPVDSRESGMVFILPGVLRQETKLPEGQGELLSADGDSDRREIDSPDPSELRTFQSGDPLNRVHWKLSARQNELMVKELSEPVKKLTWLYLNLQERASGPAVRNRPEVWDHFVETAASVSAALVRAERAHMVFWVDASRDTLARHVVTDEETLQEMLCALLRADSYAGKDYSPLLKENSLDETKGSTYIKIDLQGDLIGSGAP